MVQLQVLSLRAPNFILRPQDINVVMTKLIDQAPYIVSKGE